ncbi:MAG: hypothetical protein WA510_28200 [Acidobacteriaceae bacterium]
MGDGGEFDPRILLEEKERLSSLPYFRRAEKGEHGVLLSDRIKYYCGDEFKLIDPFVEEFLCPAGYDLRVGFNYAIGGNRRALNYGESFTIGPYQVAVIQTLETLNIPEFLIGRWNIRVKLAYKGLLWVGGAQVDPGFRGRLACPIYNLSTGPVQLVCGEKLAMIDFVTTTEFIDGESKPFKWWTRSLIFQEYPTELRSGVEDRLTQFQDKLADARNELTGKHGELSNSVFETIRGVQSRIDTRIDTFLTLVFTVVAVLFAGLGVVATKGSDDPSFVSSPVWVAAVALYFALRPYAIIWSEVRSANQNLLVVPRSKPEQWYEALKPRFVELFVALIILGGSVFFHAWHAHVSAKELANEKTQVDKLTEEFRRQKDTFGEELRSTRTQSDLKIQSLQKQIELLKRK